MKSFLSTIAFLSLTTLSACAHASLQGLLHGQTLQPTTLNQALQDVRAGEVVVIGENHGLKTHQGQQLEILTHLRQRGLKVSLGMEFFTYTFQSQVDQFLRKELAEVDFLKAIGWGSPDFSFYRDQVISADLSQGEGTYALNAPRSLTSQVSKQGLESLTPQMRALLPPNFTLGRESYKKRFLSYMPHLPTPEAGDRYFAAQSIWDDTMAWKAVEFLNAHPDQVLVIIVGEFHTQFGGGLPDRIMQRKPGTRVLTFTQFNTVGMADDEIVEEVKPSIEEGPRGQYLWLESAR